MIFDQMWSNFEAYQPQADKYGFGDDWRRMTTERSAPALLMAKESAEWALWGDRRAADAFEVTPPDVRKVIWALEKALEALIAASCAADSVNEVLRSTIKPESASW